jgi:hypothetical protein
MKRLLVLLIVGAFAITVSAQWMQQATGVPAYHLAPYTKADVVPPIMPADQLNLADSKYKPVQRHAYELAAKIPKTIYQQPCYCYCDRGHGHQSLHSCFESPHGSNCAACMKELYYSYLMTKQKKTAEQIRQGIVAGEWQSVNLETAASIN